MTNFEKIIKDSIAPEYPEVAVTVHQTQSRILLIEAIHEGFIGGDKAPYQEKIVQALLTSGARFNMGRIFIFENQISSYTQKGHLCTKAPTRDFDGYTTYFRDGDALIMLKEIDALLIDYRSYEDALGDFRCSGIDIRDSNPEDPYRVNVRQLYEGLEINGTTHFLSSIQERSQPIEAKEQLKLFEVSLKLRSPLQ